MSEKKLRCKSWCKDCKAFDWSYCTEKYFKCEKAVLPQTDVSGQVCNCGNELTDKEIFYETCLKCGENV